MNPAQCPGSRTRLATRLTRRHLMNRTALAAAGGALAGAIKRPLAARVQVKTEPTGTETSGTVFGELRVAGVGNLDSNPALGSRIESFRTAYRNIQLSLQPNVDTATLVNNLDDEDLPNVFWADRFDAAYLAAEGVVLPLFGFINRDRFDVSPLYPGARQELTFDDLLFGLPGETDVRMLYVNLEHLHAAGVDPATIDTSNWDQLAELGKGLARADGSGTLQRIGLDPGVFDEAFWLWGYGNGATFLSDDGANPGFTTDAVVDTLERVVAMVTEQGLAGAYENALGGGVDRGRAFIEGRISMMIATQRVLTDALAPSAPDMPFMALPIRMRGSGAGGPSISYTSGGSWYIASASSRDSSWAGWAFVNSVTSREGWAVGGTAALKAARSAGIPYVPALTGNVDADDVEATYIYSPITPAIDSAVNLMTQLAATAPCRPTARFIGGRQINAALYDGAVLPVLRGEATAPDALAAAQDAAQRIVDSY